MLYLVKERSRQVVITLIQTMLMLSLQDQLHFGQTDPQSNGQLAVLTNHLDKLILSHSRRFPLKNSQLRWTNLAMVTGSDTLHTTQQECGVARAELGSSYLD